MIDSLLNFIAPHYCCSCGEIGSILCESCKYDISSELINDCLLCGRPAPLGGCVQCRLEIQRTWYVGSRTGNLERLIDRYKFDNARSAHTVIGELLLAALPEVPQETIVVPIPTVRQHVRQRGYDHTLLVAKYVAKKRGLTLAQPLMRTTTTVQRGANRKQRLIQAKAAFGVRGGALSSATPYLLVDDVVTTGATMLYGAKTMRAAGAREIWAVAASRQPVGKIVNNRDK